MRPPRAAQLLRAAAVHGRSPNRSTAPRPIPRLRAPVTMTGRCSAFPLLSQWLPCADALARYQRRGTQAGRPGVALGNEPNAATQRSPRGIAAQSAPRSPIGAQLGVRRAVNALVPYPANPRAWAMIGAYLTITPANTTATILINLIRMFSDGPEVSLNGSPTVSPTTAALCASEPFPP